MSFETDKEALIKLLEKESVLRAEGNVLVEVEVRLQINLDLSDFDVLVDSGSPWSYVVGHPGNGSTVLLQHTDRSSKLEREATIQVVDLVEGLLNNDDLDAFELRQVHDITVIDLDVEFVPEDD